jgi:hypothetical protein
LIGKSEKIDGCWETSEKKAWDTLIENKYSGKNPNIDEDDGRID